MSQSSCSRSGCFANAKQNKNGWRKVNLIAKTSNEADGATLFYLTLKPLSINYSK